MTRHVAVSIRSGSDGAVVVQAVTVIMRVVVGLTFLFGFGRSRRVRGFLRGWCGGTRWLSGLVGRLCIGFRGLSARSVVLGCLGVVRLGLGRVVRVRGGWLRGRSSRCWWRSRR